MDDKFAQQQSSACQYDKLCRICLTDTDSLQYIFSPITDEDSCTYADLISHASTVKIVESDGLPVGICTDCLEKTLSAYEYRQQVEQSEAILKDYINLCGSSDSMIILVSEDFNKNIEDTVETLFHNGKQDILTNEVTEEVNDGVLKNVLLENNCLVEEKNVYYQLKEKKDSKFENTQDDSLKISYEVVECNNLLNIHEKVAEIEKFDLIEDFKTDVVKHSDYDCTMCSDSFKNVQQLKAHTQTHPKGSRHYCRVCLRSYARASIMKRHFFTHNGVKDHRCKICGKAFFYLHALRAHIMFHKKKFQCKFCQKRFAFKQNLLEHLKTFHFDTVSGNDKDVLSLGVQEDPESDLEQVKNLQYDCTMCFKTFSKMKDLIEHKKLHPAGMKHTCRVCSKTYTQAASLQRHLITHSSVKPYLCPLCGKSYSLRNSLKSHMLYHNEKMLNCEQCQKKFYTKYDMREHIRVTHSDERYNFMCELCGKLCTSGSRLAVHRESHSSYCCPYCTKTYRNLYILKMHIKKHDDDPKTKIDYVCDYCGVKRSLKIFMERHILIKHLRQKSYKCSICNKAFYDKSGLEQHRNVHLKRSHQCHVCGRSLTSKRSLMLHQNIHTGQRPFACDICGKGFASSTAKYVHQKRWHIDGKYQCGMCPEKFRYSSDLYKHMPIHTSRIKIQSILTKIV